MINLTSLKRKSGPNPGGSINLYLCSADNINFIPEPDPVSKIITSNIILKPGTVFSKFEFNPGKCKLSNPSVGQDGSGYFETLVDLTISGDDAARLSLFGEMINGQFIAVIENASRAVKLAGSMEAPLLCRQVNYDAGGDIQEPNGTIFQFKSRGFMVKEYAGLIPLVISTAWRPKQSSVYCIKS